MGEAIGAQLRGYPWLRTVPQKGTRSCYLRQATLCIDAS